MPCFATVFYKCSYNTGYCVVAEFIVQSEPGDCIKEALQILKTWNPNWHPKFFHDQLFWGRNWSFEGIFPGTTVYFCDCHRERPEKGGFATRNRVWVVKMLSCFLISFVPVHGLQFKENTAGLPLQTSYGCPQKLKPVEKKLTCVRGLARPG